MLKLKHLYKFLLIKKKKGNSFSVYSNDKSDTDITLYNITQNGIYDKKNKNNIKGSLFRYIIILI